MRPYGPDTTDVRVALVTGGAAGLGRAIVEDLAAGGSTVVVLDRDIASIPGLVAKLGPDGRRVHAIRIDLTDHDAVRRAVADVVAQHGRIHQLVNNAGFLGPVRPLVDTTDDDVRSIFELNVHAVVACTRAVARHMIDAGGGSIVTIASLAGKEGPKDLSLYSGSKAAVIGFTKSWAKELVAHGIRVNCVSPSLIDETGMQGRLPASFSTDSIARIPMGRAARPSEVARIVSFLLSDDASYVTGACYDASGGRASY